jgi:hypothetical protein
MSSPSIVSSLRRFAGRYVREGQTHFRRLRSAHGGRKLVILPSNDPWQASSNLRAWLVAPALEQLGWRVVVVPESLTLAQRRRVIQLERPDALLIQQFRHPLNDPALYPDYPCVMDEDGADFLDQRHQARIAQICGRASALICGSSYVASLLSPHCRGPTHTIWTCSPRTNYRGWTPNAERRPIVAWAHASPLAYHREAELLQSAMVRVGSRVKCELWMFGSREEEAVGWFVPLRAVGIDCVAVPLLPYNDYLEKVAEAAIGLQPVCTETDFCKGKSFGKVLAYLSGSAAVIATDAVDHGLALESGRDAMLIENDPNVWGEAIAELIVDVTRRARIAENGRHVFESRFTMAEYARRVDAVLCAVIERG